jgi:hypothetical protein
VLVLRNGFTVVGTSACASPENFNAELGRKIARTGQRDLAADGLRPARRLHDVEQLHENGDGR